MTDQRPFWERKSLSQMTDQEWEALCDGCGKCCILLLEDEETDEVWETDIKCQLFDCTSRTCTDYANRLARVPGCVDLRQRNILDLKWMPDSCAYKRVEDGRGLASWHPLVTGKRESVVEAGIAVAEALVDETEVAEKDQEDHITGRRWPVG